MTEQHAPTPSIPQAIEQSTSLGRELRAGHAALARARAELKKKHLEQEAAQAEFHKASGYVGGRGRAETDNADDKGASARAVTEGAKARLSKASLRLEAACARTPRCCSRRSSSALPST